MQDVNDDNFDDAVVKYDGTVVVKYFSTWCGPCERLSPTVTKVSEQMGDVKFAQVDVDGNFGSTLRNKVKTIPTIIVYKNGEVVAEARGCSSFTEAQIKDLASV